VYIEKKCEEAENITKVSEIQSRLFGKVEVRSAIQPPTHSPTERKRVRGSRTSPRPLAST